MMHFTTTTHGKWILCGEHAVIRGYPALVFPLGNYALDLSYEKQAGDLNIQTHFPMMECVRLLWKKAWSITQQEAPGGLLRIQSNIPIGQGMGASAALCLAIARTVIDISQSNQLSFLLAKELEHLFHSQSSGLDIIGAGSRQGQWFQAGKTKIIPMNWQPNWRLTPTGSIGNTTDAVEKLKQFAQQHPEQAQKIDAEMAESTNLCFKALAQNQGGLALLSQGMKKAAHCFEAWGLINPAMQTKMSKLYQLGALAVKPTGSGGGGYLLSLWKEPTISLDDEITITLPVDKRFHPL